MAIDLTDKTTKASAAVGVVAAVAAGVVGAPVWGALIIGSAAALGTKKAIDYVAPPAGKSA